MQVTVTPLTDMKVVREACATTMWKKESSISFDKIMTCEHGPIRCLVYWVMLEEIPTFVSVHLVRHKIGVEHFVSSNRDDRGGKDKGVIDRNTPVNHGMFINAQALINMARKRLCAKAHPEARRVMQAIKDACPEELQPYLKPECEYRGNVCHELHYCGKAGVRSVWKSNDRKDKSLEDNRPPTVGQGDRGREPALRPAA